MKDQITVRLPRDLSKALADAAKRTRTRRSDVIRLSLAAYLGPQATVRGRPIERVRGLIGSLQSGIPDLAEKHRKYVLESLKNGR